MLTYQQFITFLEKNGCRKEFEKAFYDFNRCHNLSEGLWDVMGGDEFFLGRAFDWEQTPQGHDFWKEVDSKWQSLAAELQPSQDYEI